MTEHKIKFVETPVKEYKPKFFGKSVIEGIEAVPINLPPSYYTKKFHEYESELKKYKDIEEELGIDLTTLAKALKCFWDFDSGKKVCCPFLRKNENCKEYELVFNQRAFGDTGISDANIFYDSVWLKDYGKTWALTKKK